MERDFDRVHLVRPQEVDSVKPVFDSGEALLDHIESQLSGGGVLQVRHQRPHRAGAGLQLRREGGGGGWRGGGGGGREVQVLGQGGRVRSH